MERSSCRIYVISLAVILTICFVFLPNTALATGYSFTPIDARLIDVFGINNRGIIVGVYGGDDGRAHGYLYDGVNITPFEVPGADATLAYGINDHGIVVGEYFKTPPNPGASQHGFVYDGVNFAYLDVGLGADYYTKAHGINNRGIVVGEYGAPLMGGHGFLYDGVNITYPIDVPGVNLTIPLGINDHGIIVGEYYDEMSKGHGFLYDGVNFTYPIDVPGAVRTELYGINNRGIIVGLYLDDTGGLHGFLYDGENFTYPIDAPGATRTELYGINDHGIIVGMSDGMGFYSFVLSPQVPEPSTMLLLGSGLIGLAGYGRKKFFKK